MTAMAAEAPPTVADFLAVLAARGASPNTIEAYRGDLLQFVASLTGGPAPVWSAVGRAQLHGFARALAEEGRSEATIARKLAAVKSFFRWLAATDRIARDPTAEMRGPALAPRRPPLLSTEQVAAFVRAPPRPPAPHQARVIGGAVRLRDEAMVRLLVSAGPRASELCGLNLDDLALDAGAVLVARGDRHEREIPIDPPTVAALDRYLAPDGRPLLAPGWGSTPALFVNHRGERITRQGFWLILKARCRAAGLPRWVTAQALRFAYGVHLLDQDASLADVQHLLGHVNVTTTLGYRAQSARAS